MKLVDALLSTGPTREPTGLVAWVTRSLAAAIALGVVYATVVTFVDLFAMTIVFLSAMLVLVFLRTGATPAADRTRPHPVDVVLAIAAGAAGVYFALDAERIITRISLFDPLSTGDIVFGTILLVLTIEATRRTVGLGLTLIVLVFVVYNLFGDRLPGALGHGPIGYEHFLDLMVFTTDGIFGVPIRVAATYAFLFVMFGTFLSRAGGGDFFFNVAAALTGRSPGGPAKVAVVSSGLYGMLSGSPTSDVVTTGSITIPMMRRLGYSPVLAGAVEVAASTGGSVVPPVMGSAAFIMAEHTGIDYRDIAIAAIVPAVLYYLCVYTQVHLRSQRLGLAALDAGRIPKLRSTLRDGGLFAVPVLVLTVALLMGYSPTFVAVFGTLSVVAVAALRRRTRFGVRATFEALVETTERMVLVTGACAAAGLVIGGMSMTGLAAKFSHLVFLATGSHLFLSLLMAAAITILLGMGMPTPSAYILAAVLVGPVLVDLGLSVMAANMFLVFFASMSAMTPPVAVAAFAASAIARANPIQIGSTSVRLAVTAFVVPFTFVYGEELLLHGDLPAIVLAVLTAVAGVLLLAVAAEGFLSRRLAWGPRLLLAAAGICFIFPSMTAMFLGSGLVAAALGLSPVLRDFGRARVRVRPSKEKGGAA